MRGDSGPLKALYSHRDDVSLANPFGPPVRGWAQAAATMDRAALNYRDGRSTHFDRVAEYTTADLAYIVEEEHYEAKIGGSEDVTPVALRGGKNATRSRSAPSVASVIVLCCRLRRQRHLNAGVPFRRILLPQPQG